MDTNCLILSNLNKFYQSGKRNYPGWNSLFGVIMIYHALYLDGAMMVNIVKKVLDVGNILHFMKGTPYIYQGEEIGMTNVKFPNLAIIMMWKFMEHIEI